ncbi:MAG: FixH family protein [Gammaproteobacteria bacterium]
MMESQTEDVGPWYRQRWPWYIVGLLMFGVVGAGALVVESIRHVDPLVVGDYYKEGLAINQVLDRQRNADALGLQAQADYDAAGGMLSLTLTGKDQVNEPVLKLRFILHGDYDLILEPEDRSWRLDAHLNMPVQSWKLMPEL